MSLLPLISIFDYGLRLLQYPPISLVALAARRLGVVRLSPRPARQPGGNGVRGGLLGHAVVADHSVEAAPGGGVLSRIVRLQRGRDTSLVLRGREGRRRMTDSRKSHASKLGSLQPKQQKMSGWVTSSTKVLLKIRYERADPTDWVPF